MCIDYNTAGQKLTIRKRQNISVDLKILSTTRNRDLNIFTLQVYHFFAIPRPVITPLCQDLSRTFVYVYIYTDRSHIETKRETRFAVTKKLCSSTARCQRCVVFKAGDSISAETVQLDPRNAHCQASAHNHEI